MSKVGGKRKHPFPTQAMVRHLFVHVPDHPPEFDHGLCWFKTRGARAAWKNAGCKAAPRTNKEQDRYLVKINGVMFNVRDLIWIYYCGTMPEGGLKLIDGNPWNLSIENIAPRKPVVSFF